MQPISDFKKLMMDVVERDYGKPKTGIWAARYNAAAEEVADLCRNGVVFFNHQEEFTIATIVLEAHPQCACSRVFPGCTRKAKDDPDNRKFAHMTALCRAVRLFLKVRLAEIEKEVRKQK